jgi:tetratricopeptide (TPR) repeat protein
LLLAELVVAGSVVESAGKLRCTVYVIAVDGQRIVGSVQIDGTHDDLNHRFLELSTKVAALAGIQLPPIKPEQLDDSPVGRLHLMRGISLYYANNTDRAIVSFLRAVQFDPRLQEARLWIAKAYLRQGEKEHARIELERLARNPAASPLLEQVNLLLAECNSRANPKAAKPAKN